MKWLFSLFILACCQAQAEQAVQHIIQLPHPPNGDMLHLAKRKQLLVSGYSQFERWLSLVDVSNASSQLLPVPENAQFFAQATLANADSPQLVYLTLQGVSKLDLDTRQLTPLVSSTSIYRVVDGVRLRQGNFVVDLGSGRSDFLISDFQHTHLFRQQADGSFAHYALQIDALVTTWRDSSDYNPRKYYLSDVNLDGLTDLVFVREGQVLAFMQQADGAVAEAPKRLNWPVALSTEQQADQRNDAGRSYSGQYIDRLRDIKDIDGDGLDDLVIDREQLADALERSSAFHIHFAAKSAEGLTFQAQPDTRITTETSPIDVVIDDFNGDGRQDFYIPSTHFGVGTLIRVLLRGSANLDIDFYLLDAQRQYQAKADFRQHATIDVSIGNLRYDMPLYLLADIDGDGQKALILGKGGEQLLLHRQTPKRLFNRRAEKLTQPLPKDARKVRAFDLTGNGKQDLLLPFTAQEDASLKNQLHLLLFN